MHKHTFDSNVNLQNHCNFLYDNSDEFKNKNTSCDLMDTCVVGGSVSVCHPVFDTCPVFDTWILCVDSNNMKWQGSSAALLYA